MNPCCVYDFTAYEEKWSVLELKKFFKKNCKKWGFQLEKGAKGTVHWQGRFSLKLKKRFAQVLELMGGWEKVSYVAPTSNENRSNLFYVMKEETRLEGPWTDEDKEIYIPVDVRKIEKLRPFQKKLKKIATTYHERRIDCVVDTIGCNGKTLFTRFMMVYGLGQLLPFVNDFKDIMRMVMDLPKAPCYFVDMPRAISKERLFQFWAGIELVKTGYAYDDRYHFKQELFDPPRVIVFMNEMPDVSLLSRDRWKFWEIREEDLLALRCHDREDPDLLEIVNNFNFVEQPERIYASSSTATTFSF